MTMKTKGIGGSTKICFAIALASVTWLYPSKDGKVNQQTVQSGIQTRIPAVIAAPMLSKLIVDPAAALGVQFQDLRKEWKARRGVSSSLLDMSMLEPYQKIIALGKDAVPHIIAQLKAEGDEPDQWFWALRVLTGANPVKPEDRGDFRAMSKAWIDWGARKESSEYAG